MGEPKKDYAGERDRLEAIRRAERQAERDLNFMSRRTKEGGNRRTLEKPERVVRTQTKIEIPRVEGKGQKIELVKEGASDISVSSGPCPFGELTAIDDETSYTTGIKGGIVHCGDQNFNVEYYGVDTSTTTNSADLISIKLDNIAFSTDDDETYILPGVTTSTGTPSWEVTAWTTGTNYPDNINPATPTGTATIYVPLGKLTIADGVPTWEPTGCGNITINQCGGIVSSSRS